MILKSSSLMETPCLYCQKLTTNPKYCSRSCAARHTNTLHPKRITNKKCVICNKPTESYRRNRCPEHYKEYKNSTANSYRTRTLEEYFQKESLKNLHKSSKNVHIRALARSWFKHLAKLPCAKCGYNKHVELCHVKPISSFPKDALLGDVNSENNIIQLCPNCHWEFDNNLLHLNQIKPYAQ